MPHDPVVPGNPADWLRHARSDLAVAEGLVSGDVLVETLCYHAQQAVEKSLKAVLVYRGIEFPYTHNIARLITIVRESNLQWQDELDEAADTFPQLTSAKDWGVSCCEE